MKKSLLVVLVLILAFACLGCQSDENENNDAKENSQYILDVSFVATVDELIDDPNTEEDVPRYAVIRPFQAPPVLVDLERDLPQTLEEDETYKFVMKQTTVEMVKETYDLATVIPLYNLEVESIGNPVEGEGGPDAVSIVYTEIVE